MLFFPPSLILEGKESPILDGACLFVCVFEIENATMT